MTTNKQPLSIEEGNRLVAAFMEVTPEIEYCVGHAEKDTICYSPKEFFHDTPALQKAESERWLNEQREKYPTGWVTKEGYTVRRFEWFPRYDSDWSKVMPVVEKIEVLDCVADVSIVFKNCVIFIRDESKMLSGKLTNHVSHACQTSKIDAVWQAVINFIKWYNSNQSKTTTNP